jgi:hypothetical protein
MVVLPADRGGATAAFWVGCLAAVLLLLADLGTPIAPALPIAVYAGYLAWRGGAATSAAAADRVAAMAWLIAAIALGNAVAIEVAGLRPPVPGEVVTDLSTAIVAIVTGLSLREALLTPALRDRAPRDR